MPYVRLSAEEKARRKAVRDQINADKKERRQLILAQMRADRAEEKARKQAIKEQKKIAKVAMLPAEKLVMKSTFIGPLLPEQRKRTSRAELQARKLGLPAPPIPEAVPSIFPPRMVTQYQRRAPPPIKIYRADTSFPRAPRRARARAPRVAPAPIRVPIPQRLPVRAPRVFDELNSGVLYDAPIRAPAPRGLGAPAPPRVRRARFLGAPP